MDSLLALHEKLMALYAHHTEMEAALAIWNNFLKSQVKGQTTIDNQMFFGRDDPTSPDANFHYAKTYRTLIQDSEEIGQNFRLHRNAVVAFTYALWEDEYRNLIAVECGFNEKNAIESVVFQDLNKYRQAVLHVSGRLDREPQVIRYFREGDVVAFTKDQMYDLFSILINELNQIGKTYYKQDPQLALDKSMRPNKG